MSSPDQPAEAAGVQSTFYPEPPQFSDDEPTGNYNQSSSIAINDIPRVSINAAAEHPFDNPLEAVYQFHVLVAVRGPSISSYPESLLRAPIDLVMVLETSGNMNGSKLDHMKRAVKFVIYNLGPLDRLSIVSFATVATRVLPLRRMNSTGRKDAKCSVDSLVAEGWTNIVDGLAKGARILEERQNKNPVAAIILLSDGRDTCYCRAQSPPLRTQSEHSTPYPEYIQLLPASIYPPPEKDEYRGSVKCCTFPVHSFGLGSDHDPTVLQAISLASGGSYSFVESYEIMQDAIASCIGGLLTMVAQDLHLMLLAGSSQVKILSIPTAKFGNSIHHEGKGQIYVQDLYACEIKEFLIKLQVPKEIGNWELILGTAGVYKDVLSNLKVQIPVCYTHGIPQPERSRTESSMRNMLIDRQRIRVGVTEGIKVAQQVAEGKDMPPVQDLLIQKIQSIVVALILQPDDELCEWLLREIHELRQRWRDAETYEKGGRAYALSNECCHGFQRATTTGHRVNMPPAFEDNDTPSMVRMLKKSRLQQHIYAMRTKKMEDA